MTDERNDYLWDGSGEPDPVIVSLERALAPLRHRRPKLPRRLGARAGASRVRPSRARWILPSLAAAATVVLVAYAARFAWQSETAGWEIARRAGAPRVNDEVVRGSAAWRVGDTLETDARSEAEVAVGLIGSLEVGPNSRLTMVRARASEHRVALDQGSIRAVIWAPPGLFFVDTPSAVAVDLGCVYTLDVAPDGSGLLRVETGWVGFEHDGRESFIPAGAMCPTRPGRGPGTPYYEDASAGLVAALRALDFGEPSQRASALDSALAHARTRDAFSVWHLLARAPAADRGRVFDRLAALASPPGSVTRAGILRGDRRMLDRWWDSLGLESASWYRLWQSPWLR